jgi:hypothetical protein
MAKTFTTGEQVNTHTHTLQILEIWKSGNLEIWKSGMGVHPIWQQSLATKNLGKSCLAQLISHPLLGNRNLEKIMKQLWSNRKQAHNAKPRTKRHHLNH